VIVTLPLHAACCRQAAKKQLELERQMEWEQQRRSQLDVLKLKEMGIVERLDCEVSKLKSDLATLVRFIGHVTDFSRQIF